jgi:hypothetical protein
MGHNKNIKIQNSYNQFQNLKTLKTFNIINNRQKTEKVLILSCSEWLVLFISPSEKEREGGGINFEKLDGECRCLGCFGRVGGLEFKLLGRSMMHSFLM